jgi:transposase
MFSSPTPDNLHTLSAPQLIDLVNRLTHEITELRTQVAWFKRQLFGPKSERCLVQPEGVQGVLGEGFAPDDASPPPEVPQVPVPNIKAAPRTRVKKPASGEESTLFFDAKDVPVEVINVPNPEISGLREDEYEIIGEKTSYRLAQRPGSYVVLKYVRPLIKRRDTQALSCPPAPTGVIEGSRADVSFIAGLLVDKCVYHLPLYRLHQRLEQSGIHVSRAWLTQLSGQAIPLLEPIHDAQLNSIRASRVKWMDETPIKAGQAGPGKLKAGYFWPLYGQADEICFLYYPSRAAEHVFDALGDKPPDRAVLQTDGYSAYTRYVEQTKITHAQCWAHCRRGFFNAKQIEPAQADSALQFIAALYAVEEEIRERALTGEAKRALRQEKALPIAQQFFAWADKQFASQGFLPSSPFTKALVYARERQAGLMVYLDDPDVAIDTNHLERALRVIPMGRKNWMFCWTELGAKQIGIVQSLLVTCRLHDIDPYDYLVDVLQRVGQHPASRVEELTPRLWKQHFADNPLRSPLYQANP